jgi:hypothetical protein
VSSAALGALVFGVLATADIGLRGLGTFDAAAAVVLDRMFARAAPFVHADF